jgi:hypothetical protein
MTNRLDHLIIVTGLVLSALTLFLLGWMLINCWRRESLPEVRYGGLSLPQKRLRWIWVLVLLGALGFGVAEDPIFYTTPTSPEEVFPTPEAVTSGAETVRWSLFAPLPFVRYERQVDRRAGVIVRDDRRWSFLVPMPLLAAMFAYLALVVFWHPERRSARRILLGRRAVREEWEREEPE